FHRTHLIILQVLGSSGLHVLTHQFHNTANRVAMRRNYNMSRFTKYRFVIDYVTPIFSQKNNATG
ncbi:MAG: hypothetical protein ACRC55_05580, partial [Plesiomonas sp.]